MRFIEGLVAFRQESREVVTGRHLSAMDELYGQHSRILSEISSGNWTPERVGSLLQELGDVITGELMRQTGGLKAARALIFLGRYRLPLPAATIY